MFYDQLGLAQSLAPKKKLRFKNKLLSLDASVIDLCLSMFNWATFRQTKGAVKLHLLLDHDGYLPVYAHLSEGNVHEMVVAKSSEFCQGYRCGHGSGLCRLQTLRPLDQSQGSFFPFCKTLRFRGWIWC